MGGVLIFGVVAVLMLATRHFDWYALTAGTQNGGEKQGVTCYNRPLDHDSGSEEVRQ